MRRLFAVVIAALVAAGLLVLARGRDNGNQKPEVETKNEGFSFVRGPVNGVVIERGGARLAVYGQPVETEQKFEQVLLTHHRRDVLWAARGLVDAGAKAVAPAAERSLIETPGKFWDAFTTKRFHDYAQQSTKILATPLKVDRWVKDGDVIEWQGLKFRVLETPGYTRGAVSYLLELEGKRIAFTGDLRSGIRPGFGSFSGIIISSRLMDSAGCRACRTDAPSRRQRRCSRN